jgi:hypothetical protein
MIALAFGLLMALAILYAGALFIYLVIAWWARRSAGWRDYPPSADEMEQK